MNTETVGLVIYVAGILLTLMGLGAYSEEGDDTGAFVFFAPFWPLAIPVLFGFGLFRLGRLLGKAFRR